MSAASAAANPPAPGSEPWVLNAWAELRALAARRRATAQQRAALRPELARLLIQKHAELATPGRTGAFSAYLRAIRIPRQTAYDLIARFAPPQSVVKASILNELNCTGGTASEADAGPGFLLTGRKIRIRFRPHQAVPVYLRLDASCQRPQVYRGSTVPCDPSRALVSYLVGMVADNALRTRLDHYFVCPEGELPPLSPFAPAIVQGAPLGR